MRFIKKGLAAAVLLAAIIVLCVYIKEYNPFHKPGQNSFIETDDGKIVDASGVEYSYLAHEGQIRFLDNLPLDALIFEGSIAGEPGTLDHLGLYILTGMYSVRGDRSFDILFRVHPDSEWLSAYQKTSLPPFDLSTETYP